MGLLSRLESRSANSWKLSDPRWYGPVSRPTISGADVSPDTALGITAVWNGVVVIAGTFGTFPAKLYRRRRDGGNEIARDHPVHRVLTRSPNPWQSPSSFFENAQGHALLRGNAYAEVIRNGRGEVERMVPLHPGRMKVEAQSDSILYRYTTGSGEEVQYRRPDSTGQRTILHVAGQGNGVVGHSPVTLMREALGLAMAAEEFSARFYENDATPGGVLKTQGIVSDDAYERVKKSWNEAHSGNKRHSVAFLEEGLEWQAVGFNAEDAQLLGSRRFQLEEVARMLNIQPHLIKHLERSTNNNIEHQGIEFYTITMRPWLVRWEQALQRALLTEAEQDEYYIRFNADAILRGDSASRSQYYREMFGIGSFSINDILELEDRNPVAGGDQRFVPLNMVPLDAARTVAMDDERSAAAPVEERSRAERREREVRSIGSRRRTEQAYSQLFTDAATRAVKRETNEVRRAIKKHLGARSVSSLTEWLERFYEDHGAVVRDAVLPVLMAYAESMQAIAADEIGARAGLTEGLRKFTNDYAGTFASRHVRSSLNQLLALIRDSSGEEMEAALRQRLDEWDATRGEKEGRRESRQAGEAIVFASYQEFGVERIRSVASGSESCPICQELDGKVIGIRGAFIRAGQAIQAGSQNPIPAFADIRHPPYHDGCSCNIVSA